MINVNAGANKMNRIKVALFSLALVCGVSNAQTLDLIRTINTNSPDDGVPILAPQVWDTEEEAGLFGKFTQTGTLTIESGFATFDIKVCIDAKCLSDVIRYEILTMIGDHTVVLASANFSNEGFTRFKIISTTPTLIIMQTDRQGTVELTEWAYRN